MKISDFIKSLEEIKEEYGDLELVYSRDDEGNGFDRVQFYPSVGHFDINTRDWYNENDMVEMNEEIAGHNEMCKEDDELEMLYEFNSVCIN